MKTINEQIEHFISIEGIDKRILQQKNIVKNLMDQESAYSLILAEKCLESIMINYNLKNALEIRKAIEETKLDELVFFCNNNRFPDLTEHE